MARSGLSLSVCCRRQRGYLLTEVLLGLLLAVVLVTLVFTATGTAGRSFERLQDELQLQEARRHILAQLEKTVCYDAQSVRLQADGKISCRMLEGCKQVTVYSDKQGIYQRTRTNKGTGVNPVSLEGVGVFAWQVRRCSPQMLCVSFNLYRNGRSMRVTQYLICYSARITDDA